MRKQVSFGELPNFFPAPVVLVSCKHDGKENIIPLAWVGVVCSKPPMVGIAIRPHRFSHSLISDSGEFVVNVPGKEMLQTINGLGACSGKDTNKFRKFGLHAEKASKVSAPLVRECKISMECKLKQKIPLGSHDLFIGEVLAVQADGALLKDGKVNFGKLQPLVFLENNYFAAGEKAGVR